MHQHADGDCSSDSKWRSSVLLQRATFEKMAKKSTAGPLQGEFLRTARRQHHGDHSAPLPRVTRVRREVHGRKTGRQAKFKGVAKWKDLTENVN